MRFVQDLESAFPSDANIVLTPSMSKVFNTSVVRN